MPTQKPSERIKEIAKQNLSADKAIYTGPRATVPVGKWIAVILEYLDEEAAKEEK